MKESPTTDKKGTEETSLMEREETPAEEKPAMSRQHFHLLIMAAYAFGLCILAPMVRLDSSNMVGDVMSRGMSRFYAVLAFAGFWTGSVLIFSVIMSNVWYKEWGSTLIINIVSALVFGSLMMAFC